MAEKDLGRTISVGVGLKEGELAQFEKIARQLDFSRNAIMAWALRRFLRDYAAGKVEIPVDEEVKRTLGEP